MAKFYIVITFLIVLLSFQNYLQSNTVDEADSALVKKYWNRIEVKSISSLNNNLYTGIDNYLTLICPDNVSAQFQYYLSANNGELYDYDEGTFLAIPQHKGWSFVSVHVVTDEGDTLLVGKKQFSVINLPVPYLKIGNTIIKDQEDIDKQVFYKGDSLKLFFTEDLPESSTWYKIEYFSIGYSYSRLFISAENNSPVFQKEAFKILEKARPGLEMVIKVNSVSPSGLLRNMPLVRFRVH